MIEIAPRLHHLEPCVAQNVTNAIALRRRQIENVIHPIDQVRPRHAQVAISVRQRAQSETDQDTRDSNDQADPDIRPSWQDRSLSAASPAPMDRLRFRKSCSIQVSTAPRQLSHRAPAMKDTPRWSRIQRSQRPPPSEAIDSAVAPRARSTRIGAGGPPARTRAVPAVIPPPPAGPSRHAAPVLSARRRETHDRTSRIPSDAPAARIAARL